MAKVSSVERFQPFTDIAAQDKNNSTSKIRNRNLKQRREERDKTQKKSKQESGKKTHKGIRRFSQIFSAKECEAEKQR